MKLDWGYIYQYMIEYDTGVPLVVIIGVSIFVFLLSLGLFFVSTSFSTFARRTSFCMLVGYFFLVLCATVFYRDETYVMRYTLRPLWSYTMLYSRLLAMNILNILLFIPIGLLLTGALKKHNFFNVIGLGFLLSSFIEVTQLITTRGIFNIDDIIHNVLGCAIGYLCFLLSYKIIKMVYLRLQNRIME